MVLLEMMQIDSKTIKLVYSDNLEKVLDLKTIQNACPCKLCKSRTILQQTDVSSLLRVDTVGRYGLKFHFVKGCAQGIYPHALLRGLE